MESNENGRDADVSDGYIDEGSVRSGWDGGERPSTVVVEAVAAAIGRDAASLSPLDRHVDTEALDSFLTSATGPGDGCLGVSFDYEGVEVTVDTDGGLDVRAAGAGPANSTVEPTTDAELNTMLRELLQAAFRNGLSVRGGWPARNGSTYPDWDVHVTRLEKPEDASRAQ